LFALAHLINLQRWQQHQFQHQHHLDRIRVVQRTHQYNYKQQTNTQSNTTASQILIHTVRSNATKTYHCKHHWILNFTQTNWWRQLGVSKPLKFDIIVFQKLNVRKIMPKRLELPHLQTSTSRKGKDTGQIMKIVQCAIAKTIDIP
jgi:hypothetical protein